MISDREEQIILDLRNKGYTNNQIAKELKKCGKQILKVLKKHNLNVLRYNKKCEHCGIDYTTTIKQSRFCSDSCRQKEFKKVTIKERKCQYCGKVFIDINNRKYCSYECRKLSRPIKPKKEYIKVEKIKRACEYCGKEFITTKNSIAKFCSNRCAQFNYRKENNMYVPQYEKECLYCGEKFIANKYRKFCKTKCMKNYHTQQKEIRRRIRMTLNGKIDTDITLEKVIKKENNICYLCGKECNSNDYCYDEDNNFIIGNYYPTIEHIIPISKGGSHTWDNVKLAHFICNCIKGDKI